MSIAHALAKLRDDPGRIADRLYYTVRGAHPGTLRAERDTDAGTLRALATLARLPGGLQRERLADAFEGVADTTDARELAELFASHGSDKSTTHDYHVIYAGLLSRRRREELRLLEIGLGTNNVMVPSNMGPDGTPGASLRAFRDWAPEARVYGADIDKNILFCEERIATDHVDQTSTDSLASLTEVLPEEQFDLIIDDGLHSPWANVNTLNFALPLLAPGGAFVVEDILDQYLPAWEIAAALLRNSYSCRLIRCSRESVFLVERASGQSASSWWRGHDSDLAAMGAHMYEQPART